MRYFFTLLLVFIGAQLFSYYQPYKIQTYKVGSKGTMTEVTNKPADFWWIHWTGAGDLKDWTVSNTLQGGVFPRPPACGYFDGTWNCVAATFPMMDAGMWGLCGEYPAGSKQYYNWASGPWVGALYPKIQDGDTIWQRRVSKGAYYSDLGGMSIPELENTGEAGDISGRGLAFSTQILPTGYGYTHEGSFIFKQPGMAQEEYQALWPFADTAINKRREDTTLWVNPAKGDIISIEDTYACAGDWIPEKDASCIWVRNAGAYDVWGLGIRVEQRTYSWNYDYNNAYIYLNWKIRNMNPFPLKNVYVGYFMDNDIGSGITATDQGAEDDLIGYDRELNLGYTYDSDGYEPGWQTAAGYMGAVLCETPGNIGFTGFQYWMRVEEFGMLVDDDAQDSLKYMVLATERPGCPDFMVAGSPGDMRQLSCSGPYPELKPNEEITFTVAVIAAHTLDELKEKARYALEQFNSGYLGFSPPPSPDFSVIPGDKKVYISWSSRPESYVCPMSKEHTFEGYKVYKSRSGLPEDWKCLATYDLLGSKTQDTVIVKYTKGTSKATISFEGIDTTLSADIFHTWFATRRYRITFDSEFSFILQNLTDERIYLYNKNAPDSGIGYCIMDTKEETPYPADPGYVSGAFIYLDGFYIKIKDSNIIPDQPGVELAPCSGDEFTIWTYESETVGNETGLEHYYIDTDVTNGMKYYYTVTSFSRPIPRLGIGSLESGKTGTSYWAIPTKEAADFKGASCELVKFGIGNARVEAKVVNPTTVTGDTYTISFFSGDTLDTMRVDYWRLVNKTTGSTLLDSCYYFNWEPLPIFDGLNIKLAAIPRAVVDTETVIDSEITKWSKGNSNWKLWVEGSLKPGYDPYYDYELTISDTGSIDLRGKHGLFTLWNTTRDTAVPFLFTVDRPPLDTLSYGDKISIYKSVADYNASPANWAMKLEVPTDTTLIPPELGDIYKIKVLNKITTELKFELRTTKQTDKRGYTLDSIRVVPNPYYVRAPWDISKFQQKIWFQGLPSECTIRIFNVAGLLIKTIEHKETEVRGMKDRTEITGTGAHAWDLLTDEKLRCVSGLYIYQVITTDGKQKVGKFAIIR
ncbi:MAG: hypothetical protein QMD71_02720 [bacterium]|nr:hypothetical protein [bacterium]